MNITFRILTLALTVPFILASCAKDLNSNSYVDSSTVGIVYEGTIISARPVQVKDSAKLGEKPGIGALGGGVGGALAGSELGKGKGSTAGGVGGAIAGAVIGAIIEDQLSKQTGMEYLVKLSKESMDDEKSSNQNRNNGGRSVSDKLRNSTSTKLKSSIISVVQGMDNPLSVGTKVYVIYNDDRPRVVPATY